MQTYRINARTVTADEVKSAIAVQTGPTRHGATPFRNIWACVEIVK